MIELSIARRTGAQRCASCHGDLGLRYDTCRRCGTALHADCRKSLARCPSLGCGGRPLAGLARTTRRTLSPIVPYAGLVGALASILLCVIFVAAGKDSLATSALILGAHVLGVPFAVATLGRRRAENESAGAWIVPIVITLGIELIEGALFLGATLWFFATRSMGEMVPVLSLAIAAVGPIAAGWIAAKISSPSER